MVKIRHEGWVFYVEKPSLRIRKADKKHPKSFLEKLIDVGKKAYVFEEKEHERYEEAVKAIEKRQREVLERKVAENIRKMKEKEKLKKIL